MMLQQLVVTSSQSGGKAAEDADKQDWKFGRNEGQMTWPWKLMCAILYMLPWVDVTEKTVYFVERFPAFVWTEYFSGELRCPPAGCRLAASADGRTAQALMQHADGHRQQRRRQWQWQQPAAVARGRGLVAPTAGGLGVGAGNPCGAVGPDAALASRCSRGMGAMP